MDRITNLPDNVIDIILEKLPVIDRVKSSFLSTSWKLKWTSLSSLHLCLEFYESVHRSIGGDLFDFSDYTKALEYADIINSLVLQYTGSLKEFTLWIPYNDQTGYSLFLPSIDHVMKSSSLQRLMLVGFDEQGICVLPSSIFFSVSLRRLDISGFQFQPPSWFAGFPNLTHFTLDRATTTSDIISQFVSLCPRLEEIRLDSDYHVDQNVYLKAPRLTRLRVSGDFIHVSVSNAQNLVSVSMSLSSLFEVDVTKSIEMFKLFKNSTELQKVTLWDNTSKFLGSCGVIHRLPRFGWMKVLNFLSVALHDLFALQCLLSFCASSPSVEELTIWPEAPKPEFESTADPVVSIVEYINGDLGHLRRVYMFHIWGTKIEMKIIELLFLFSPVLEGMHIVFHSSITGSQKLQCLQGMINFYRASTKVKFYFPQTGGGEQYFPPCFFKL